MKFRILIEIIIAVIYSGCVGSIEALYPPQINEPTKTVYITRQGWHAEIVLKREDIPSNLCPEKNDFPNSKYLRIGWGDNDFYRQSKNTFFITMKAVFWPTSTVIHVYAFDTPVEKYSPYNKIIEVKLSENGFRQLCVFIHKSYSRNEHGEAIKLGAGLIGEKSTFYKANGKYFALNT